MKSPIEFSYFDPIQESFVSASTLPHPLQVDRGEQWNLGVQGSNYPKQTVESNRPPVSDLFQAESEPGEWTATLTPSPLMNQPAFWYFQAIPFAGICSLTFWGIRRKTRGKEKFKAKENSLTRQMKDAVGFNDASSLLRAFRDLLRLKVAKIHKYPNPSSLASDELIALLKAGKNSDEVISCSQGTAQKLRRSGVCRQRTCEATGRRSLSGRLRNIENNQIMNRLFFVFASFLAFASKAVTRTRKISSFMTPFGPKQPKISIPRSVFMSNRLKNLIRRTYMET